MRHHLPDLEAWAIFAKVAECGSFSRAAEALGLAKTTVSKAVGRLEARMQTSLFHRTTRKLSLTQSGRLSLERARRILADGTAIEADIAEEAASPRGLVRLATISAVGVETLAPILPAFMAAYPDIQVDMVLTENQVDVVAEGFDAAIMVGLGGEETASLSIEPLSHLRRPLVAAPALIARLGLPTHPLDLPRYPAIIASHIPRSHEWQFARGQEEPITVRMEGRYRTNNAASLTPMLLAGVGLGLIAEAFVAEDLAAGRLVELLGEWSVPARPLNLVTPAGRAQPARVRVLLEFLRHHLLGNDRLRPRPAPQPS